MLIGRILCCLMHRHLSEAGQFPHPPMCQGPTSACDTNTVEAVNAQGWREQVTPVHPPPSSTAGGQEADPSGIFHENSGRGGKKAGHQGTTTGDSSLALHYSQVWDKLEFKGPSVVSELRALPPTAPYLLSHLSVSFLRSFKVKKVEELSPADLDGSSSPAHCHTS